jgi:transcriptional activator SPT7
MSFPEGPSKWAYPDTERLWKVAHDIEERQLWAGYLSEQEHIIWRKALRNKDAWDAFLSGHGEGLDPVENQDSADVANGTNKAEGNSDKHPDAVTTSFRARSMLFDCSVRKLFPSRIGGDLMNFDIDGENDVNGHLAESVVEEKPKTRDIEEDDYDEDEDEASGTTAPQSSSLQAADTSSDQLGTYHSKPRLFTDESPPLPEIKSFPIDTYYHTLEHDRVAMLELQTVEELNRQNNQEGAANGAQSSLQHVNFGAANLSLKHLLSKIDVNRDKLNLTDAELRKLFSDVRKNRSNSKWASDDLIGREELYEALESMLKKIMADRNALPFMSKVRRLQAPDYYNIIKRPMDLGTLQRNLRTGTYYKSKAQFMEELDLIWENCLTYNTDPVSKFLIILTIEPLSSRHGYINEEPV